MNEYIPVQKTDVSMIAYLEDARDHETLLRAWKEVEKDLPGVILNIIGDGILRKKLEALTTSLSLQNVCFQGRVTNVEHYLWSTKVYVFSTLREGFGITLLEALAAGCQVVATDVPACREVLDNGMYGDLIPLRNSTLLANAIVEQYRIMLSPSEIESRQRYIQKFTPEKMLNSYVQTIFQGLPQTQQLS